MDFPCTTFGEFLGLSFLIMILTSFFIMVSQQILLISNSSIQSRIISFKISNLLTNIFIIFIFLSFLITLFTNSCTPSNYY